MTQLISRKKLESGLLMEEMTAPDTVLRASGPLGSGEETTVGQHR